MAQANTVQEQMDNVESALGIAPSILSNAVSSTVTPAEPVMIIPQRARDLMAQGLAGQTAIGMSLLVMFDANPFEKWQGNGSSHTVAKHRTMSKAFRNEIMSEFNVSNSLVSESYQATINHPDLLACSGVVVDDTAETVTVDIDACEAVFAERDTNGFIIRIARNSDGNGNAGKVKGTKQSAVSEKVKSVEKQLTGIKTLMDQASDGKMPVKVKKDGKVTTVKASLTAGQIDKIVIGAVAILKKYAPEKLADKEIAPLDS